MVYLLKLAYIYVSGPAKTGLVFTTYTYSEIDIFLVAVCDS